MKTIKTEQKSETWPNFNRIKVGNCAFCLGASWGPHEKTCFKSRQQHEGITNITSEKEFSATNAMIAALCG